MKSKYILGEGCLKTAELKSGADPLEEGATLTLQFNRCGHHRIGIPWPRQDFQDKICRVTIECLEPSQKSAQIRSKNK